MNLNKPNVGLLVMMVGFLVGGKLTKDLLKNMGKKVMWISLGAVFGTAIIVTLLLMLIGVPLDVAILLGCIATATDPAAIMDVVEESNSKGYFVNLLPSIVAVDDAWGLILFSIGVAMVGLITGLNGMLSPILLAFKEIFGAMLLGFFIGFLASFLTGRVKSGRPILFEALGIVFLCGGLAIWLEVSYLIAAIVIGMTIANLAKHHDCSCHEIEDIEPPFLTLFFVLAGASFELGSLKEAGVIVIVYVIARIAGKVVGAKIGGKICRVSLTIQDGMGLAWLPQAGVAMGMALVASIHFPEHRQLLLSVVISTTIFFELLGPLFTRMALRKVGNN